MSEAASADRPPEVRRDVLLRLGRQLRERSRRSRARREGARSQVLNEHAKDPAALASLDRIYESQGMYENLAGGPAPADRDHRRQRGAGRRSTCGSARVYAEALEERRSGDRQLPGGAGARVAVARGARRPRAALLPRRALERALRRLREDRRHRPATRWGWPTATRGWPSWPPTRSTIAPRRSSSGARWSTSAARTPSRSRAWPICTRWPASGRR